MFRQRGFIFPAEFLLRIIEEIHGRRIEDHTSRTSRLRWKWGEGLFDIAGLAKEYNHSF